MSVTTAEVGSVTARRRPPARSVLALAWVEAGRMLRHPAFLIGVGATVLAVIDRSPDEWAGYGRFLDTALGVVVAMSLATLLTGALVAGRQRFLSDPDLFPAVPTTAVDRVLATALGLLGPALVTTAVVAAIGVRTALADGFVRGQEGYATTIAPSWPEWVQPALLVALAGIVGIAVAHLRRGRLAALLFVLVACFVGGTAALWIAQGSALRVLHPVMSPEYERRLPESFVPAGWDAGDPPLRAPDEQTARWREVHVDTAAVGWHLVYLGGLILLGLWIATRMADREDSRALRWLVSAAVPLLLLGGVAQMLTAGVNR